MKRRHRVEGERGESLLELIIAITILGVCVVAVASGIAVSIKVSAIHRDQATASAFLHNYAETLQGAYQDCATAGAYNTASLLPPPTSGGFNSPQVVVTYWNGSTFSASGTTCSDATPKDPGLQQVTLTLSTTNLQVSESLVVVLRRPT
jgi:type II secretory pathway pseudopilin PulG